jgi:hypothetical protein
MVTALLLSFKGVNILKMSCFEGEMLENDTNTEGVQI